MIWPFGISIPILFVILPNLLLLILFFIVLMCMRSCHLKSILQMLHEADPSPQKPSFSWCYLRMSCGTLLLSRKKSSSNKCCLCDRSFKPFLMLERIEFLTIILSEPRKFTNQPINKIK